MDAKKGFLKDDIYDLLKEKPTRQSFREFLQNHTGEHDDVDFKEKWVEKEKLIKLILAMANSGGGAIIVGVREEDDNTYTPIGIPEFRDKKVVQDEIYHTVPEGLAYEIFDYSYDSSDYKELMNKKFQIVYIKDEPKKLPFITRRNCGKICEGQIFVRRGTSNEVANHRELEQLLKRRMETGYVTSGISLVEHIEQLETLYSYTKETISVNNPSLGFSHSAFAIAHYHEDNIHFPEESFQEFLSDTIVKKKELIRKELGITV